MGAFLLLFFLSLPLRYTLLDTSWELLRPLSWNLGCNIQIFSAKKKNNAERLKKKLLLFLLNDVSLTSFASISVGVRDNRRCVMTRREKSFPPSAHWFESQSKRKWFLPSSWLDLKKKIGTDWIQVGSSGRAVSLWTNGCAFVCVFL